MENKRGLSEVMTTLIIILLVLVAIGIVWVVVSNIMRGGSSQAEIQGKCLLVDVVATKVECTVGAASCTVSLKRLDTSSGTKLEGVEFIYKNAIGATSASPVSGGDISDLVVLGTTTANAGAPGVSAPTSVDVILYYTDDSGNIVPCNKMNSFSTITIATA